MIGIFFLGVFFPGTFPGAGGIGRRSLEPLCNTHNNGTLSSTLSHHSRTQGSGTPNGPTCGTPSKPHLQRP